MQNDFDVIAELQYRRKFYIKAINRQRNAAGALVRRAMGWTMNDSEEDREKVRAKSATIAAKAIENGECEIEGLQLDFACIAAAIAPMQKMRDDCERDMKRIVKRLPIYAWTKPVRGLGEVGVAVIIGECGDLANYSGPAKVWKRLGLAPFEKNGVTMAASNWRKKGGLDADDWTAYGYSPRRRAEMYAVIGDPLFRQQTIINGPYRQAYDARRARTAETHPDWTKGHSRDDALRVMTKKLLADLWCAWNGRAKQSVSPRVLLPSQPIAEAA